MKKFFTISMVFLTVGIAELPASANLLSQVRSNGSPTKLQKEKKRVPLKLNTQRTNPASLQTPTRSQRRVQQGNKQPGFTVPPIQSQSGTSKTLGN